MTSVATVQLLVAFLMFVDGAYSANILFALSMPFRSHKSVMDPVMSGLLKNGHNVTVVSPFPSSLNPIGVNTIEMKSILESADMNFLTRKVFSLSKDPIWDSVHFYTEFFQNIANLTFSDPDFKKFISGRHRFDLLVIDGNINDHLLALHFHFKCPMVHIMASEVDPASAWELGIPHRASVSSLRIYDFPEPMSFKHRVINLVSVLGCIALRYYVVHPLLQEIVGQHFPGTPPLLELERNSSLVFYNDLQILMGFKPSVPHLISIGGIHCRPEKNLDKELAAIVDASGEEGFIVFSLGSIISEKMIPIVVLQKLLKAFSAQNRTIIWKFDGDIENLSENVKIRKWIPQQDLLGHPKCRLFINHGGYLGLEEAVYHAVPVLVFPATIDVFANKVVKLGIGKVLQLDTFTVEEAVDNINKLINNPRFKMAAKKLSALMKDRPMDLVEKTVYWMEYVIRTDGAHHLKSITNDLSVFQYILFDVIAACVIIISVITLFVTFLTFLIRKLKFML